MDLDTTALHRALADANRARAYLYLTFMRAMERRWGRDAAISVMREAIRNWGHAQGKALAIEADANVVGLLDAFIYSPDGGRMFAPEVRRCDREGLDAQMMECPLKAAWQDAGLSPEEAALLCNVASEADQGILEAAGFVAEINTWRPGDSGCCVLKIRKGQLEDN
jgi:hypothetical protein